MRSSCVRSRSSVRAASRSSGSCTVTTGRPTSALRLRAAGLEPQDAETVLIASVAVVVDDPRPAGRRDACARCTSRRRPRADRSARVCDLGRRPAAGSRTSLGAELATDPDALPIFVAEAGGELVIARAGSASSPGNAVRDALGRRDAAALARPRHLPRARCAPREPRAAARPPLPRGRRVRRQPADPRAARVRGRDDDDAVHLGSSHPALTSSSRATDATVRSPVSSSTEDLPTPTVAVIRSARAVTDSGAMVAQRCIYA